VGLASNDDDVNGIALLPDGRLLLSTLGDFTAVSTDGTPLNGTGTDIIAFTPTSLGPDTAGSWGMYFNGLDVGLDKDGEKITAVAVDGSGNIYLTSTSAFNVPGLFGDREDVFVFEPATLGDDTSGAFRTTRYFDGSINGLDGNSIYGLDFP
jgi:hypothetical protein